MDDIKDSVSLKLARQFLNKIVDVTIDRKIGTKHPKWEYFYEINYGYLDDITAPDGEDLDVYILLVEEPLDYFKGRAIAIIHRLNDDDDRLVVVPDGKSITDEEIEKQINFQEKYFKHIIFRG